ncbi:unnamed protein product [Protopolystoma xenopodis]|uniref:Uncharacterized protein n=1 Tax=Protopolystoma xenopodis TaxID=117903 RepID=A0A448WXQ7_9PLAT|nr:unnamed protein product [Protopolystoma xenopodis]
MQKIIDEKKRQRTTSVGSLDGMVITRDNELVAAPPLSSLNSSASGHCPSFSKTFVMHNLGQLLSPAAQVSPAAVPVTDTMPPSIAEVGGQKSPCHNQVGNQPIPALVESIISACLGAPAVITDIASSRPSTQISVNSPIAAVNEVQRGLTAKPAKEGDSNREHEQIEQCVGDAEDGEVTVKPDLSVSLPSDRQNLQNSLLGYLLSSAS